MSLPHTEISPGKRRVDYLCILSCDNGGVGCIAEPGDIIEYDHTTTYERDSKIYCKLTQKTINYLRERKHKEKPYNYIEDNSEINDVYICIDNKGKSEYRMEFRIELMSST